MGVFISVLFTMPGILENITSIQETSSEVKALENSIHNTKVKIVNLEAEAGSIMVNFTLNNNGTEKLWNFEKFNVLVTYDVGVSMTTEELTYSGDCAGGVPSAGNWCIQSISSDVLDPGILNDGESASIRTQVNQNLATENAITIVTTDNGVVATRSAGS